MSAPSVADGCVSAVICTHSAKRLPMLARAIASLRAQTLPLSRIVLVVDGDEELAELARREVGSDVTVICQAERRGLSAARNRGAAQVTSEIVVFLDDDAVADHRWVERLAAPFSDPRILGCSGMSRPEWEGGAKPAWMPEEFLWVVGCTYRGAPEPSAYVRNVIGGCAALRRSTFEAVGGYDVSLGYSPSNKGGGEEAELGLRMLAQVPNGRFAYEPEAFIWHHVPRDRARLPYFVRRCYAEGKAKQRVSRRHGRSALAPERAFAWGLPRAASASIRECLRGRPAALASNLGIFFGAVATGLGMLAGMVTAGLAGGRRRSAARGCGA